jgi:hypothetical protein
MLKIQRCQCWAGDVMADFLAGSFLHKVKDDVSEMSAESDAALKSLAFLQPEVTAPR